jgi:hypothetical protein
MSPKDNKRGVAAWTLSEDKGEKNKKKKVKGCWQMASEKSPFQEKKVAMEFYQHNF